MGYNLADLRSICDNLTIYTGQLFVIRRLDDQIIISLNKKTLFQTSELHQAREYLKYLQTLFKKVG